MNSRVFIVLCVLVLASDCAHLPGYFTKCKKSDPEIGKCIVQNTKVGIPKFAEGDSSYRIQSIKPLKVPFIHIDVNGGLICNLTDVVASGLENIVFEDGMVDFDKKHFQFKILIPLVEILSQYDISGRILVLPITGQGPSNITFVNADVDYSFEYDLQGNNKHTYIVPKNSTFTYTAERVYFRLENLFNGDKQLGEEMNKFLDESWKPVNEEIGEKVGEAVGQILTSLIGAFFSKVPFEEMFD